MDMKYTKKFAGLDEPNAFVDFHMEETGLKFSFNRELKTAWIEVDEQFAKENSVLMVDFKFMDFVGMLGLYFEFVNPP